MRPIMRHTDHDPSLVCRPAMGNGLCEPLTVPVRVELPPVRYTGRPIMTMIAEALGRPDCYCNYEHCGCDWPEPHPCDTCDCGHSAARMSTASSTNRQEDV